MIKKRIQEVYLVAVVLSAWILVVTAHRCVNASAGLGIAGV